MSPQVLCCEEMIDYCRYSYQGCPSCCSSSEASTETWQESEGTNLAEDEGKVGSQDAGPVGENTTVYELGQYLDGVNSALTPEHRAHTVDSMIAAAAALHLQNDSLFTAVACLDRYLAVKQTQASLLQPAGIACLWIAAKYEESYSQFLLHGSNFSKHMMGPGGQSLGSAPASLQLLVLLERSVLEALDYRLASIVTTKTFKHHILQQVCNSSTGSKSTAPAPAAGNLTVVQLEQLYCLTSYLTEIALLEYQLLSVRPDQLAAAAFATTRLLLGLPEHEAQAVQALTGFTMQELSGPMEWLFALHATLHAAWRLGRPYACTIKYCDSALHAVAAVPPITSTADPRLQCSAVENTFLAVAVPAS